MAVHATASASASRSTRNFINASASTSATTLSCRPLPTAPPDRAGTHRTLGREGIGCAPDPVDLPVLTGCPGGCRPDPQEVQR
ncbi:hypothetical protein DLE60_14505 [Micromonospora globispora]|uniref:Uncharacterized protein n=1 Tax=Micromonospora globispora TaxID=1450148 RepID=A0A317JXH0_9ACTN|nr:hypothetical protein DLJ46_21445 [Micromonospora globispora]PWU59814.1 hypothetical protein DLE60_14505 [Micromonospora globispora]